MAQIVAAEQQKFRTKGLWVRERCDAEGCHNAIGWCAWNGRSGRVFCSEACRDATEQTPTKHRKPRSGQPAVVAPVAKDAEHKRGEYVAGYDSIEQAIVARLQKEPREPWNAGKIIDALDEQGAAERPHIRQAIWNLLAQGQLAKDGRVLKLCSNGAKIGRKGSKSDGVSPSPSKGKRTLETHSKVQETHADKRARSGKSGSKPIKMRDVPAEED